MSRVGRRLHPRAAATLGILCAVSAAAPLHAGPASPGRAMVSVAGGSASAYGDRYVVLGLGAGLFVLEGLLLGADGEAWFGGERDVYRVSPQLRFQFDLGAGWQPYAGGYYRHTFVERGEDFGSLGGRLGVLVETGGSAHVGGGVVFESLLDCDSEFTSSCTQVYPEVQVSISF